MDTVRSICRDNSDPLVPREQFRQQNNSLRLLIGAKLKIPVDPTRPLEVLVLRSPWEKSKERCLVSWQVGISRIRHSAVRVHAVLDEN